MVYPLSAIQYHTYPHTQPTTKQKTKPTNTACDVLARFMRLSGRDVFFLSGTDEHGQKVEQSAAKQGVDPQTFVDSTSQQFRQLLDLLHITNDQFIRTTDAHHKASVQVSQIHIPIRYKIRINEDV